MTRLRQTRSLPGTGGPRRGPFFWVLLGTLAAAGLAGAPRPAAADSPFAAATSAAAEEDDDNVWSGTTWLQRDRGRSGAGVLLEYAFEPRISVEVGLERRRARRPASADELEAEAEMKYLFNHIARDGWGLGVALSVAAVKEGGEGWRGGAWRLLVPFSLQWGTEGGFVHLNAGWQRERGEGRSSVLAAGVEVPLTRRLIGFAELAREGDARLTHGGLRWWLKRERMALDVSALRRRDEPGAANGTGWRMAFSLFDL